MFEINNITKAYKNHLVIDDVSLHVKPGEAVGILGANGSGKSTLLSCIAKENSNNKELNIGYVPQDNPLFDELKPIDNLRMWTKLKKDEIKMALMAPPVSYMGVNQFLDTAVKDMSGGMKKRLSIASVLINQPSVLLLDEPFAALDLLAKQDILAFMRVFLSNNGSILVASHDENIFNFCNRVLLLKDGKLHDVEELKKSGMNYIDMLRS